MRESECERKRIQCCATFTAAITACCSTSVPNCVPFQFLSYSPAVCKKCGFFYAFHLHSHIAVYNLYLKFLNLSTMEMTLATNREQPYVQVSIYNLCSSSFSSIFHCANAVRIAQIIVIIITVRRQQNCDDADLLFSRKT